MVYKWSLLPGLALLSFISILGLAVYEQFGFTWEHTARVFALPAPAPVVLTPLHNVTQIATGLYHTCAIMSDGGVQCWGKNDDGELGDGTYQQRKLPVAVIGLSSGVSALDGGEFHTCAVLNGGAVKCWGANWEGQLGDGTQTYSSTPVNVVGLDSGVSTLTVGYWHTCAVQNGGVKCWGDNRYGQLGDGTTVYRTTPVAVSGLSSGVIAVTGGILHTCALTANGGVLCWGKNDFGQLGDNTQTSHSTPTAVSGLSSGVQAIAAGSYHTCALLNNGAVKCWGWNWAGQVGDGGTTLRTTPADVVNLNSHVLTLATGAEHTCALTDSGGVKCWGFNGYGQLGDGTQNNHLTPVDVAGLSGSIRSLATGGFYTCAVTQANTAQCWGHDGYEQLGDGITVGHLTPTDVFGLTSGVSTVTAGLGHTCSLMNSGGVKCWGNNDYGQLGDATFIPRKAPVDVVGLTNGMKSITTGDEHTCGLTNNGVAQCWGKNGEGELGNGNGTDLSTPVNVLNLQPGVKMLAAGGHHACAVTNSDAAQCWGYNYDGQLGDGTTNSRYTPVPVSGLSSGVISVAAGRFHTCALMQDGGVKCWGLNDGGQLGDGTTVANRKTPVSVIGLGSPVSAVAVGDSHTCALTTNGGVKCWGWNGWGQVGNGNEANQSMPADVVGLQSGVRALTLGGNFSCALTTNGGVKCWGRNGWGQVGDGSTLKHIVPTDVTGLASGVSVLTAGDSHTCAVLTGGVQCWGLNGDGQLGDDSAWRGAPASVLEEGSAPTPTTNPSVTSTPSATMTPTGVSTETATPTATASPGSTHSSLQNFLPLVVAAATPSPTVLPSWQRLGQAGLNVAALAIQGDQLLAGERRDTSHLGGLYKRNLGACVTAPALKRIPTIESSVLGLALQDNQGVVAAYDIGMFYTPDNGATWAQSSSRVINPRTVLLSGGIVYAGTENDGIYISDNNGETWTQRNGEPKAINVLKTQGSTIWIGTDAKGVWKLIAGGAAPIQQNNGLNNPASKNIWDFGFDTNNMIYLATADGIYHRNGNANSPWQLFDGQLKELRSLEIVGDHVYVGVLNGGVWQHALAGGAWQAVISPDWNNQATVRDLFYDTQVCHGLLAATDTGVWVYR